MTPPANFKLFQEIVDRSEADTWEEAKKEWHLESVVIATDKEVVKHVYKCLCTHEPLKDLCYILNDATGIMALVGNCCVEKFMEEFDSGKIVQAIKKKKINARTLDFAYEKKFITLPEYNFVKKHIRKRKLSSARKTLFDTIEKRIFGRMCSRKKKTDPRELEMLKSMDNESKQEIDHVSRSI